MSLTIFYPVTVIELWFFNFLPLFCFLITENLPLNILPKPTTLKVFPIIFVNYSCIINFLKLDCLKQNIITQLLKSEIWTLLGSVVLDQHPSGNCTPELVSSKLNWGKIPPKLIRMSVVRPHIISDSWLKHISYKPYGLLTPGR